MFCTCNSCVVYMYDTHACINVPEIPLSICAFIIFIPAKCFNTVTLYLTFNDSIVYVETYNSFIRVWGQVNNFYIFVWVIFFLNKFNKKKKSLFYERAFNVQKKILDDITCL